MVALCSLVKEPVSRWFSLLAAGALLLALGACGPLGADATAPGTADAIVTNDRPVVTTDLGPVRGVHQGDAYAFKGIPYAAPPIGGLRWRPPAPATPWSGVRDASSWGARCIQLYDVGDVEGSEDCLFLNVWRPVAHATTNLPVLVFMHGGSNVWGSSSDSWNGVDAYDGANAAALGPAVVVSINYRVAAMGFLASPAFAHENGHDSSGNYGLLDQQAALRWVQRNIAAFGGDPSRVMLFGQSAGAIDTCEQLVSPGAAGLFSRALMMSGSCYAFSREDGAFFASKVARRLGCQGAPDLAGCLRGKSAEDVTRATRFYEIIGGSFFNVVVDGWVIPRDPQMMLDEGDYHHMPLVVGTTTAEMSQFMWSFITEAPTTDAAYRADVNKYFGTWTDRLLGAYPAAAYGSHLAALEAMFADSSFLCPSRDAVLAASRRQTEPVRRYVFAHTFDNPALAADGAAHGYDVFFALHNLGGTEIRPTAGELALGGTMVGYFTRFAATGDPNGGGAPFWPTYDAATHQHLRFDEMIGVEDGERASQCALWEDLYGR